MAETIKGLTVKIGADTSDFIKELKKVDKQINSTQKIAKSLQQGLELEYDESRFIQAQEKFQQALSQTEEKAESIRKKLKELESGGFTNTDGYKDLQEQLALTETKALRLKEQLDKIDKIKFENATKGITDLSDKLEVASQKTVALSAAAVGAIAGIAKLGSDAAATGADIQDMADRLGITAEQAQKFSYIALQSATDADMLAKGMIKIRDAIGTMSTGGTNTAVNALQMLFGDLNYIPTDTEEAFNSIIEKLSQVEDSTMQAYYANELFGERLATELIPFINNGAERLEQLGEEFESIGYLSNEQVSALADFDDQLNIMRESLSLAKTELGIAMLPLLEQFSNILTNYVVPAVQSLTEWFSNLPKSMQNVITGTLLLLAGLSPLLLIFSKITSIIPVLITGLNALATHPIIAVISAVAGLLMYLYMTNEAFANSINNLLSILGKAFSAVFKPIANLLQSVLGMLSPIIDLLINYLSPALELISYLLEPIAFVLEKISDLMSGVGDFVLSLLGKGWLWGKEDTTTTTTTSVPSINDYNFTIPNSSNNNYNQVSSNDNYNFNITMNTTGNLDYDVNDLVNEVAKKFVLAKQSSGR